MSIHPSSIIDPAAKLGAGVKIGPFCVVGPHVELGDGVELKSHVAIAGHTTIGAGTRVFPFASLGHEPQDLKFKGEITRLEIGARCTIREGVTMNPGTGGGGSLTKVGDDCTFLAYSHVAHDCIVGNHVIFSNNVMLAGHCHVGDFVIIGGGAGVHQFVRLGDHAFVGAMSGVGSDVIPYGMAVGESRAAQLSGLNIVGLKRRGFSLDQVHDLRRAYRLLFAPEGTLKERVEDVASEFGSHPLVHEILDFIREGGERSICTPRDVRTNEPAS
ncbi:MAG: acyl-ACP--UDP-N-acetylglucosamine O-acyltransferase [Beijerinckiaceae bacterium]|nr:acyl-ACP--UDP-N-acetylglucosamine O-acyltransferase [Beijerinckiaceae bacterium]MCZ8299682.1 acyl-ACP--UDP-N-acetylglucosamine O-acyltransferase [Beijerinckiaceae bacterium]